MFNKPYLRFFNFLKGMTLRPILGLGSGWEFNNRVGVGVRVGVRIRHLMDDVGIPMICRDWDIALLNTFITILIFSLALTLTLTLTRSTGERHSPGGASVCTRSGKTEGGWGKYGLGLVGIRVRACIIEEKEKGKEEREKGKKEWEKGCCACDCYSDCHCDSNPNELTAL